MKKFLDYLTENKQYDRIHKLALEIENTFSEENVKKYPKIVASFKNLDIVKDNKNIEYQLNSWLKGKQQDIEKVIANIESNTKIAKEYIENN